MNDSFENRHRLICCPIIKTHNQRIRKLLSVVDNFQENSDMQLRVASSNSSACGYYSKVVQQSSVLRTENDVGTFCAPGPRAVCLLSLVPWLFCVEHLLENRNAGHDPNPARNPFDVRAGNEKRT